MAALYIDVAHALESEGYTPESTLKLAMVILTIEHILHGVPVDELIEAVREGTNVILREYGPDAILKYMEETRRKASS